MRLNENMQIPLGTSPSLRQFLYDTLQPLARKVNGMSFGRISDVDGTATAAPTTGTYKQGDTIRNSAPVEAGAATAKYVIVGWICVASGTPGTWLEMRCFTGN